MALFRFVALVYTVLFWGLSLMPQIHRRHVTPADALQTVCNGAYVAFWTFALFPPEYRSLILVGAALFFFLTAHGLIHRITVEERTHLYPLTAISLLLLATLAQFGGNMLIGMLAIEACVLLVYSYYIRKDGVGAPVNIALFFLFAYLGYRVGEYYFIINSYSNAYYSLRQLMFSMSHTSAIITHSIVSATLFFPYVFLIQRKKISESGILSICHLSAFVGGILSLLTYSHLVHYTFSPSLSRVADVFVLVSITLIAIYMYAQSHLQSHWYGRKGFSLMLIVYVLIRLFFVEMVTLTTELRMIVFIAIGILFMLSVKFMAHEKQSSLPH
jgi:hypothetical protein